MIAIAVLAGFLLGHGGLGVVEPAATGGFVATLAVVALVVILFRDGVEVEREMLQKAWHLPLRKLVLAMPITAVLAAAVTHAVVGLSWTESLLVGALLSPTDPVLSSTVVTNPRVPRLIRHSLNLESGLNDGLALPAVLAFAGALDANEHRFVWWQFVLQDVIVGFATGVLVGYLASRFMPRGRLMPVVSLAVAFAAYLIAVLPPHGNGLIATFVCAIVIGIRRSDVRESFEGRSRHVVDAVKLAIFFVFGALLTIDGLFTDGAAAVAVVLFLLFVARPVAVFAAVAGTRTDPATRAFMAWFGPKGVATLTFALLVLARSGIGQRARIFDLAALAVIFSIILHGITDRPGAAWIAARAEEGSGDLGRDIDGRGAPSAGGAA